jgi:hypothetical protein
MTEWHQIATAPKQTKLLLHDRSGIGTFVGYYDKNLGWLPLTGGPMWEQEPTHWMPVPAPPTTNLI